MLLSVAIGTCLVLLVQATVLHELPNGDAGECPKYDIQKGGVFHSPEYTQTEGVITGFHCWYNFKTGKNKKIVLEFLDFDLHEPTYTEKLNFDKYEVGCEKEFIEVYRDSKKKDVKERYCGSELKGRILTSSSNQMKFVLNKYYATTKGFQIRVKMVQKDKSPIDACKEMYGSEGDISAKNVPADCTIAVKAPVGQSATLTVTKVTPAPTGQACEKTQIQEKSPSRAVKGNYPVCGADILQNTFQGYTNALELKIDMPKSNIQAKISFNPLPTTCGGEINMEAGASTSIKLPKSVQTPVHKELVCAWTVTIPAASKGLKIVYNTFDLAPEKSGCNTDQFSAVEFKETDVSAFLQRRAKESPVASCGTKLKGATHEFTGGKTVYLFLSMDLKVAHERQLEAELSLL